MKNVVTNEFIQYKAGFISGKFEMMEMQMFGNKVDIDLDEYETDLKWYDYGYIDAIIYYKKQMDNNVNLASINDENIIKKLFDTRVVNNNYLNNEEVPMSKFVYRKTMK